VSLQIAILKVLSAYPEGCAAVADMNADLQILTASGRDWAGKIRLLARRAPDLDIFGQHLVVRGNGYWQLTLQGRELLQKLEALPEEAPCGPRSANQFALRVRSVPPRAQVKMLSRRIRRKPRRRRLIMARSA
jgi:hypothetical protein